MLKKLFSVLNLSLLLTGAIAAVPGLTMAEEVVEITVNNVFIPSKGYDDNDQIGAVVDGVLPNGCYILGDQVIEKAGSGEVIRVRQFATKRTDGICSESVLPAPLNEPVPFSSDIKLGKLLANSYKIEFKSKTGSGLRPFNVDMSKTATVDNLNYAAVSVASSSDMFTTMDNVTTELNGVLSSSCAELDDSFQISKQDDVFVVLPTQKIKQNFLCAYYLRPFKRIITLGNLTEGRYLVHVRSQGGKAVNRLFTVLKPYDFK